MQALLDWVEKRLPAMNAYKKHLSEYPMPKNFNFWYLFGSLAMLVLVNQLLTGIW
ncbi:cytochrome b, partial [Vibrio parahaemolyticus]|nr:cytochrome b [Vibrio parahaemolyticus]